MSSSYHINNKQHQQTIKQNIYVKPIRDFFKQRRQRQIETLAARSPLGPNESNTEKVLLIVKVLQPFVSFSFNVS